MLNWYLASEQGVVEEAGGGDLLDVRAAAEVHVRDLHRRLVADLSSASSFS